MAGTVYTLGSKKPYLNSIMILFGWFIIYFISGIILALGLESITQFLANPRPIDFYIESVVAFLLIWLAINMIRNDGGKRKKKEFDDSKAVSPLSAFGMGALINLIGLPFAIPYFAVIDQILKADMTWIPALFALFIYNFLYVLPFVILIIIRRVSGEKSEIIFNKISGWMDKGSKVIMPILLIGIAVVLLTDAIIYFTTGKIFL
jgi:threonine/homoserine/homoserine lactone efflux protein